jgi:CysZ protein
MMRALTLSFAQLGDRPLLAVVWRSILYSALVLLLLVLGSARLLAELRLFDLSWLNWMVDLLGSVAALLLAWMLYPVVVGLVASLYVERVSRAVERRYYPWLGDPPPHSLLREFASVGRLTVLAIIVNLLALPVYLLFPGVNLALFYGINGYLLARIYFEQVAMRRLDEVGMQQLWHRYRSRLWLGGAVIAALATVPIVNLIGPIVATAFMTHLFEDLRHRTHLA